MKSKILTYGLFLLFALNGFSQNNGVSPAFWRFTSLDGEVMLRGLYREKYTTVKDFNEFQKSKYFMGGLKLNTKSYLWHPDFMMLEFGGEYSPGTNQDDYLVTPDFSEVRTLKGLNIGTTLFNNKPVTLKSWASYSDTYSNRENLTNIKTVTKRWGSSLYLHSRILPVNLSYNSTKWDQNEVQTGRSWLTKHENFEASTNKSFSARDRNKITYSHNTYFRQEASLNQIYNITDNIRLSNHLFLDKEKNYTFRSIIYDYNRKGSQYFHIFNSTQNLMMKLPANFHFTATYNFFKHQQLIQESRQNKVTGSLKHKLFSSLSTNLLFEYADLKHTFYHEKWNRIAATVNYTKKIAKGQLNLSYTYSLMPRSMITVPVKVQVINEEYILADGEITVLHRPYININSVIIKDLTGSIIYQRDFDYILIESGVYLEVQRIPGGQIANNSKVYIDYIAEPTGSYKYTVVANNIYANITLFKRLLEIYYRGQFLDYKNVEKSDLLILNYIKQNTFGVKIHIKFVELGAEYEDRNSTITPYKLMRFYVNIQKRIKKFILALNGNIRDYDMVNENINRKYSDISGGATYEFSPRIKLNLTLGYRKQQGPGIDLDLFTARTEFTMVYRQLYITFGADLYRRNYLNDLTDYNGIFIQLSRKF